MTGCSQIRTPPPTVFSHGFVRNDLTDLSVNGTDLSENGMDLSEKGTDLSFSHLTNPSASDESVPALTDLSAHPYGFVN